MSVKASNLNKLSLAFHHKGAPVVWGNAINSEYRRELRKIRVSRGESIDSQDEELDPFEIEYEVDDEIYGVDVERDKELINELKQYGIYNSPGLGQEDPDALSKKRKKLEYKPSAFSGFELIGFDGDETVDDLREALDCLEVKNPLYCLIDNCDDICYKRLSKKKKRELGDLATVLDSLWCRPGEKAAAQYINVAELAINALNFIVKNSDKLFEDVIQDSNSKK